MKPQIASLVSGLLFGLGLGISGMTQSDKIINFLDLSDNWDPSLALVMVGAIGVHLLLFRFTVKRPSPLFADRFGIPTRTDIDPRLVGGSALFGVGWALSGFCPGPGMVSMTSGAPAALVFVAAMTGGMLAFHVVEEANRGRVERADPIPEPIRLEALPELIQSSRAS